MTRGTSGKEAVNGKGGEKGIGVEDRIGRLRNLGWDDRVTSGKVEEFREVRSRLR